MGRRGPKPTPSKILSMRGDPRADARARTELAVPVRRPKCPSWLPKEARAEWRRVVRGLEELGILAEIDRMCLAAYCEACAEFREAVEWMAKYPDLHLIVTESGYATPHPWVARRDKAAKRMKDFAAQFGFSPAARVGLGAARSDQGDPLDEFFARKRAAAGGA